MVQRSLPFLLAAGLMSCSGDPTGDLRNGTDHLLASPSSVFVGQDSSKLVVITAVDEQGNTVAARFSEATNVGPGITVAKDLTFAPVYDKDGNLVPPTDVVATRYIVTANTATANSSFTVTAGGKSITIPVRNVPASTANLVSLSTTTAAAGDTVTLTLPAPYNFSDETTVSIGTTALYVTGLSADSSSIGVVAPPGVSGPLSVTNVVLDYAPAAVTFLSNSTGTLTTGAILTVTANQTSVQLGDTITVTSPAPYRFINEQSTVSVGSADVEVTEISADSTQMKFIVGANANDTIVVDGLQISGAPTLGPFSLKTTTVLASGPVPNVTANRTTAAAGDTIVLTAPAGYRFTPDTSQPSVGTAGLAVIGTSADTSQLRFLIGPNANDTIRVTKLRLRRSPDLGAYTSKTTTTLSTPSVPPITPGISNTTPNVNQSITFTAPSGFRFLPSARVRFGTDVQATISVAADSLSMVVRTHQAGASGTITMQDVVLSSLTGVPFSVATTNTVNVGATVTELTGTNAPGTAPIISAPTAVGQTGGVEDAPTAFGYAGLTANCGGPCPTRIYKFVVPSTIKVNVSATWNSNEDIGIYMMTSAGGLASTTTFPPADAKGGGAGGHPETTTWTLPAGTYFVGVLTFGAAAAPTSFSMTFTGAP